MEIDKTMLRKPMVWAVIIPVVLGVWGIQSTVKILRSHERVQRQTEETKEVCRNAQSIASIMKRLGRTNLNKTQMFKSFDRVTSARQCARGALIPESKMQRIESFDPKLTKDKTWLFRESYKLNGVKLLQIAKFIDFAERSFDSLNCTQVTVYPARVKSKDAWDATISLQYVKEQL